MIHPLDLELVEMAEHLKVCGLCRIKFARVMYQPDVHIAKSLMEKYDEDRRK